MLQIRNLNVTMKKDLRQLVKDFTFALGPGNKVAIIGEEGNGKSTLLKLLYDPALAQPYAEWSGEIHREGMLLGYLPQELPMYPSLSVREFLRYMGELKGVRDKTQVEQVLLQVEMQDFARRKIGQLSGGMRRRVGIAQALLGEPPILVVDEPTAGLDPEERVRFRGVLSRYARQGRTVLLSTHIVEDVHQLCQHLAVLRKGRLFYAGPSQELLHQVEGRVKVLPLGDDRELAALQRQAVVLSTTYEQNAILARVVDESGRFPQPPVPATLEDAYVYCMGGKSHA